MLFRPSTLFQITSTLYGHTDIGKFYSNEHIDNVAMEESAPVSLQMPNCATSTSLLLMPSRHLDSSNILLQVCCCPSIRACGPVSIYSTHSAPLGGGGRGGGGGALKEPCG